MESMHYKGHLKSIPKLEKIVDTLHSKQIIFQGKRPIKIRRGDMTISTKLLFKSLQNFHRTSPKAPIYSNPVSPTAINKKKAVGLVNLGEQFKIWPFQGTDRNEDQIPLIPQVKRTDKRFFDEMMLDSPRTDFRNSLKLQEETRSKVSSSSH